MGRSLHAIVFAWPGQGHLNPLIRFSELLASQGCMVTFVHSEHNLARLTGGKGKHTHELNTKSNSNERFRFVGIGDGLPEGHPRDIWSLIKATDGLGAALSVAFDELVGSLLSAADEQREGLQPPTTAYFIVSDFFMTFTQDVANKFGLPRIAIYIQSAASFACHLAVNQGFRPSPGDKVIGCLQGVVPPTMKPSEMISFLQCYDTSDPLFDYMLRSFKRLDEPTWIVCNTFDDLEQGAIDHIEKDGNKIKHLQCGGPLLPLSFLTNGQNSSNYVSESLWEEDHHCLKWLDSQAPSSVLFVSFGSLATLSAHQAEEFALGLENSMLPFLWVIRPGLIEDGVLPHGFTQRVKERASFVSWAPQTRVLAHPSVGGFLTHCGWNSVLESIAAGVPMLGWSAFADQMLNCRCIVDGWGLGMSFSCSNEEEDEGEERVGGLVTRTQVEMKVRALMLELPPNVKDNCVRLKRAAFRAAKDRDALLLTPLLESLKQNVSLAM